MAGKRKPGTRLITGVKELDARLEKMKLGAANKVARPALTKAARHLLREMKNGVPSTHKNIKRALGMNLKTSRGKQQAKVGAGVGKASKAEPKRSGRNTGGVGIGGPNVHWLLLGTGDRSTDSGKNTGSMPAQLPGLVRDAAARAEPQMLQIIRDEVKAGLAKLAAKGG